MAITILIDECFLSRRRFKEIPVPPSPRMRYLQIISGFNESLLLLYFKSNRRSDHLCKMDRHIIIKLEPIIYQNYFCKFIDTLEKNPFKILSLYP